jgi:putative chitinase
MLITLTQLLNTSPSIAKSNAERYIYAINQTMDKYEITNKQRICGFLSQVIYESGYLAYINENLNYSEKGLLNTFPKYFDEKNVKKYAHNPMGIANRVYANRLGNGDENSNDGWNYRGFGLIQLTGKSNHVQYEKDTGNLINPNRSIDISSDVAGYFWNKHNLNHVADFGLDGVCETIVHGTKYLLPTISALTYRINGGYNGLNERISLYHNVLNVING